MLPIVFLFLGLIVALVFMAYMALSLNELQKQVAIFSQAFRNRYQPGFFRQLEKHAEQTIQAFTKSNPSE